DDDDDDLPILLSSTPKNDKKKLKATDDLADVFKEAPPKKTIYIIVQRPPPVQAPVLGRPSTPHFNPHKGCITPFHSIPSIFVPHDSIEAELTDILKGVGHNHTTNVIDAKDVETSQRGVLGRFYKRPLPYHETAADISLVMLGLELDKQAKTSEGETLRDIVDKDVGRYSDHRVVAIGR
ncbi:hypothetical protein BGX26_006681, partial [Mortierella sp. AD094]